MYRLTSPEIYPRLGMGWSDLAKKSLLSFSLFFIFLYYADSTHLCRTPVFKENFYLH